MATQVQLRRGTATENDAFTGAQGELTFDTTNKRVRVHDGATAGGFELKTENSSGNTLFADNEKAIFGAGSDLQIYHDGSNSHIKDAGTGGLIIKGESSVQIRTSTANEAMLYLNQDGAVQVYYDGSIKLATTSTGIDVTGTVTADGLTVGNNASHTFTLRRDNSLSPFGSVDVQSISGSTAYYSGALEHYNGQWRIQTQATSTTRNPLNRATFDANGDISFYEDTGTTAKFFWDASAERLGIGTTSPSHPLTVQRGSGIAAQFTTTSHGDDIELQLSAENDSGASKSGQIFFDPDTNTIGFKNGGVKVLHTDSIGNVGIGTSSPKLELSMANVLGLTDNANQALFRSNAYYDTTDTRTESIKAGYSQDIIMNAAGSNGGSIQFRVSFTSASAANEAVTLNEAARIDASGNLLVGVTSLTGASGPRDTSTTAGLGVGLNYYGGVYAASYQASPFVSNRISNDGELFTFKKDGSTVGSIGTTGGSFTVGNADTGLLFNASSDNIYPWNMSTGAIRDAAIDLGKSNTRFKDLYLSGQWVSNGTNNTVRASFQVSGTQYGYINVATTGTVYSTSSDYRLKENVVPLTNATERLKQLNPLRFSFIPDETSRIVDGFLAHEVQDIVPEAITGTKDAMRDEEYEVTPAVLDDDGNVVTEAVMGTRSVPDYQGIDQSKLVPLLVATIKELEARITALEGN